MTFRLRTPPIAAARQLDLRALVGERYRIKQRAHAVVLSPVIRFEEYRPCRARRGCLARKIFFCARGACDARAGQRLPLLAYANMTVFSRQENLVVWRDSDKPVEPSQLRKLQFLFLPLCGNCGVRALCREAASRSQITGHTSPCGVYHIAIPFSSVTPLSIFRLCQTEYCRRTALT